MEKVVIKATKREVAGKGVKALRRMGVLPAVIYGKHIEPINISLDAHSASMALAKMSSSTIVTIEVDGKEYPTLVREKQRDFIKNRLLHVDFLAVSLTEKIRAYVTLRFSGVSVAVKDYNAIMVHNLEQFHVECLPTDLPEYIEIDVSTLERPGEGIRVKEVSVSDKIRVLDDPEVMVAVATASKIEEAVPGAEGEEAEVAAATSAAEPSLSVERGKKDEDEE